jgi:hypothetical protein
MSGIPVNKMVMYNTSEIDVRPDVNNSSIESGDNLLTNSVRTIVDSNSDIFKYGLSKLDSNIYEDPTYLGFTIELDENSSLFTDVLPFIEARKGEVPELVSRISVYKEFVNKIRQVFNSQDSVVTPNEKMEYIKQHYINSISGMGLLTKRVIKWKEDKLEFELHEDISMFSTYLTHLYNNLTYSYENGRHMIPENLLYFNCYIRISEIRNLTSIGKLMSNKAIDIQTVNALKNNTTCIIYKLYDCIFDFSDSKPFGDDIIQSGIDAAVMSFSTLSFNLFMKRISRSLYVPLINNSLTINDDEIDLDIVIIKNDDGSIQPVKSKFSREAFHNAENKKPSSILTYDSEVKHRQIIQEPNDLQQKLKDLNEIIDYNSVIKEIADEEMEIGLSTAAPRYKGDDISDHTPSIMDLLDDPAKAINNFSKKTKSSAKFALQMQKNKLNNKILNERNRLIRKFVGDVAKKIGITKITNPSNVYKSDDNGVLETALGEFGRSIGRDITNDIISTLTNNNPIIG